MTNTQLQRLDALIEEKKAALARLNEESVAIAERNGDDPATWPEGQRTRYENITAGYDNALRELGRIEERRENLERGLSALSVPSNLEAGEHRTNAARPSARDGARRLVEENVRTGLLHESGAERVESLLADADPATRDRAVEWARVAGDPAYLSAFSKLAQDPERGHLLWDRQELEAYRAAENYQRQDRALTNTGTSGILSPLVLDPTVILTNNGTTNTIRDVARVVQTMGDSWKGITSAGVTAEWLAEGVEAADGTPTLARPSIPLHKGSAFVPFSYEYEQDAMDFARQTQLMLADAAVNLNATAYVTGSGVGQPKGIVTAVAADASSVVDLNTAEVFTATDVFAVQQALPARWRGRATWAANLAVLNTIHQFETAGGAKVFPEIAQDRLLRRGLIEVSEMDGTYDPAATADNYLLLFGDFREFVIAEKVGSTFELIPHLTGANGRPTGQRGMHLWWRTGSDCTSTKAFRLLNAETTA